MANGLLNNLIGYWGLDEAAGANNALDKHSGARTLTQYNSPQSGTGKIYTTARSLNGATNNRHFRRTSETALQAGDVDFTVAAWVNLNVTNAGQVIACKLGDLSEYILYYDNAAARFKFGVSVDGSDVYEVAATTFGAPSASTWYLIVGWHDSVNNQLGISINGGAANTLAHSAGTYVGTNPFVVGSGWDGANTFWQFNGLLQSVCLWKSAAGGGGTLTSQQRTDLYNSGTGLTYALLDNGSAPVTVAPTAATGVASATNPTVVLGSITVAPAASATRANATSPTVAQGAITIAPAPAGAVAGAASPTVVIGAITIVPAAGASIATATSPTVTAGTAVTVTPAAATAAASAVSPTVVRGALAIAPVVATSRVIATLGAALSGACTDGVLVQDVTNGRYFRNNRKIVPLVGFHTWANFADSGPTDPPPVFGWSAYLAALVSYGVNCVRVWLPETARAWPTDDDQWFSPLPWLRTGPGNAADGHLKFDLTQFEQAFFDRLRARVIELGNAGIYASIMLFDGWHIDNTKPGGGAGDPWAYHPFNATNNINGINGDVDGDGIGDDARSTSNTAAYNAQKAYVAKIIDTLNDLDNVLYEISNEDGTYANAWQDDLISYINTYQAGKSQQHPIGKTKLYPSGTNSQLTGSAANWIAIDEDLTPAAITSTTKVVVADSDHLVGITSERKWIWIALAQGFGGIWYMDLWDSGAGGAGDTINDATYMQIRRNLGWALAYADRMDLQHATPQGSLASTGYCLAKTSAQPQFLAYQSGTGAFTLDLTSVAGTFAVEWRRVANSAGTVQAGSNVSGGAVRTLTPPWAGEDAVVFLELVGVTFAPAAASTRAAATSTTVVLGSITVAPAVATAAATAVSPTVVLGAVTVTPAAATSKATATDPTTVAGAITLAPAAAAAAASAVIGSVQTGFSVTVTPTAASARAAAGSPTVIANMVVTYTPAAASSIAGATSPTVVLGAVVVVPVSATAAATAVAPTVVLGGAMLAPAVATTRAQAVAPTVARGAIFVVPAAASTRALATNPAIEQGMAVIVQPAYAASVAGAIDPAVVCGAVTISPAPASATASATGCHVLAGVIVAIVRMRIERNMRMSLSRNMRIVIGRK